MPYSARASGRATPSLSSRLRTSSGFRAPASARDGVYVPPEEDGPFRVTWRCGPDVAGLVGFYFGYAFYLLELAPEPLPRLLPLPRPSDTAGAVGAAGEVGELLEFFDGATGVYTFGLH